MGLKVIQQNALNGSRSILKLKMVWCITFFACNLLIRAKELGPAYLWQAGFVQIFNRRIQIKLKILKILEYSKTLILL